MTKSDLIDTLRKENGLSAAKSQQVLDLFFDEKSNALARGDRVEIRGLCSIYVKAYKGYTGRNPETGEPIEVPGKTLPFFERGKKLKERVDYIRGLGISFHSNVSNLCFCRFPPGRSKKHPDPWIIGWIAAWEESIYEEPEKEVQAVTKELESFHLGFSFLLSNVTLHTVKRTDGAKRSISFKICSSI
jgi:integration host factor subunit beta